MSCVSPRSQVQQKRMALYLYFYCSTVSRESLPFIPLFGYCSKSLPGIELAIKHRHSKILKEKIIYLLKIWGLKLPSKRYVLSLDAQVPDQLDLSYLELPILILLLGLAELISWSYHREIFVANGKITLSGALDLELAYCNYIKQENCQRADHGKSLMYLVTQEMMTLGSEANKNLLELNSLLKIE